jgi:hypothetical protein
MFFRLSTQVGSGRDLFDFWVALIAAVHRRRGNLVGPPQPPCVTNETNENAKDLTDTFDSAMAKCFDAALHQCAFDPAWMSSTKNRWDGTFDTNVSQMLRLRDLCLTAGNMKTCAQLLSRLTASTNDLANQFQVLHIPFLARFAAITGRTPHRVLFTAIPRFC